MATTWISVKGKVNWAKVYEPDSYAGAERWMVDFYPADGGEWEKLQKGGLQVTPKEGPDGKFVRLRRDTKKLFKDDLIGFCPPEITGAVNVHYTNAAGDKIRQYDKGDKSFKVNMVGEKVIIGNGSLVIVNLALFDTSKGKGHRLEGLKVLDLVGIPDRVDPPETDDISVPTGDDEIPF